MAEKFTPRELEDYLSDFTGGMNSGVSPLLLRHSQASFLSNATVRGAFAKMRPPLQQITLSFVNEATRTAFESGLFQGWCFYNPDSGLDAIVVAISGKLYKITPALTGDTATVLEVSTPATEQSATAVQHWLWQAEKWVIWNDGISNPVFFDGTTTVRSNHSGPTSLGAVSSDVVVTTPIGSSIVVNLTTNPTGLVNIGDLVYVPSTVISTQLVLEVTAVGASSVTGINTNINASTSFVFIYAAGLPVSAVDLGDTELPPGRMGTYGMGRVWMCLPDGKQFVASDIVGGSSGTAANNFRDAVLNITENNYLTGGGFFTVPGSVGDIRAMKFASTLDVSLGQGPLQIFTQNSVFSCNAPVDRTVWQDLTNPILTQSLIGSGATSQDATIPVNNDIIFRSLGITVRSLILARREFATWGNVPISDEMERVLLLDDVTLLAYASAVTFNNRLLMTASPDSTDQGVVHKGIIVINFDPLSSLRGKLPAVWDGLWTGVNVLNLVANNFNDVERCFALTLNTTEEKIELYEIQQDNAQIADNGTIPVTWTIESASLNYGQTDARTRNLLQINDGEIYVDELEGRVDFEVFFRPDQFPCWILWAQWSECSDIESNQMQFRPRMGLGTPDGRVCDESTNRPFRECYTHQVKIVVHGKCRVLGGRFRAITVPQPKFAKVGCPCPEE